MTWRRSTVRSAVATAHPGAPSVILARTRKGRGVAAVEDAEGAHGKPLPDPEQAIRELGGLRDLRVRVTPPFPSPARPDPASGRGPYRCGGRPPTSRAPWSRRAPPSGRRSRSSATRGPTSSSWTARSSDSTRAGLFAQAHPERFFEFYIAEQQLVAAGVGMQVRGWAPFVGDLRRVPHPGLRLHQDGRDQPGEHPPRRLALRRLHRGGRAVPDGPGRHLPRCAPCHGSTVLCPCDANQAAWLTGVLADLHGVSYLRTSGARRRSSTSRVSASTWAAAGCCGPRPTTRSPW